MNCTDDLAPARRLALLRQALGLDSLGRGESYRGYMLAEEGTLVFADCSQLVLLHLMTCQPPSETIAGATVFMVTRAGTVAARTGRLQDPGEPPAGNASAPSDGQKPLLCCTSTQEDLKGLSPPVQARPGPPPLLGISALLRRWAS